MALHVNIENLIKGEVVETGRIEYKSGWNPERVIHSMCAFVNDINNLGGGYIVIGVEEKDGILQLTTVGLQKNQLDAMKRNGSPEPKFKTDDKRSYFLAVLPVHPEVKSRGQAGGQAQKNDLSDTEKAVLTILRKGPCSTEEIVKELGLTKRTGALQRTLKGLLEKEFIRYLYPETPRYPGQKYVLNVDA